MRAFSRSHISPLARWQVVIAALALGLALFASFLPSRAHATITSTSTKVVASGNGVTTQFAFTFVGVAAADLVVTYTDASGTSTVLAATAYSVALNPPASNTVWGIGGTVTYPLTGSPIATGTKLTIARNVP